MKDRLARGFLRTSFYRLALVLGLWGGTISLRAHVGSPTVFFEGQAGPFQARIVVLPPDVIPGLATVSVRVSTPGVEHVTALPIRWNTGHKGAPPPDEAVLVRGETNLYSTQLWFMQGGAQSVEVAISGQPGTGKVIVPVNAVATRVLGMPPVLRYSLGALGTVLVLLLMAIVGAAVRESILAPGSVPTRRRRWLSRGATVFAALLLGSLIWLGKRWWESEAADYRHNRLYRPLQTLASVHAAQGHSVLRLELIDEAFFRGAPLVPDHGKLMHLFVMREPGLDVFGHVHPEKIDWKTFETELPSLPAGQYSLYGDITSETGFSDTLTAKFTMGQPTASTEPIQWPRLDPDDAWQTAPRMSPSGSSLSPQTLTHPDGRKLRVDWTTAGPLPANRDVILRFSIRDDTGRSFLLEPYLGMAGHLVLRRSDGAVFTHLHPGGSFSMAAQQLFEMREDGRAPLKVASATNDPICQLPTSAEIASRLGTSPTEGLEQSISFPYAFPTAGWYRLWLQFKVRGEVLTAVFDTEVLPATS